MAAITVTDTSHPSRVLEGFVAMREVGELSDYMIRGSDESFSIHSLVLASVSPVFKAMLKSNMDECAKKEATFPTISDDIMRKIIDFAYTGACTFTRDDLTPLITATHFLEVFKLLELCEEQISLFLQPSNCFSWVRIAVRFQLGTILPHIQEMMFTSFKEVIESAEFKDSIMSEVAEYLSSLIRRGIHSDIVMQAALEWIKHDSPQRSLHLPELIACVSVGNCTRPFLYKLVQENPELLEAQQHVHKLMLNEILARDSSESILILGGQSYYNAPNDDCWMFKDDHLVKFAEGPGEEVKPYHSMCQVPQGVMLTGGEDSDMCKLFDVASKTWMDKERLLTPRSGHGSGFCNGKVFVVGGGPSSGQSVDFMDLEMDVWQHRTDIPEHEFFPKVVVCNGRLFVLLTRKGVLYCLDSRSGSWKKKSKLPTASFGCSMVTLDDRVFVAGGDKNIHCMYIPNADVWCRLSRPSLTDTQGSLVCYKQKLYLITGCSMDDKHTDVEEYDIRSDSWSHAPWKLPKPLMLHAAFVVNIVK